MPMGKRAWFGVYVGTRLLMEQFDTTSLVKDGDGDVPFSKGDVGVFRHCGDFGGWGSGSGGWRPRASGRRPRCCARSTSSTSGPSHAKVVHAGDRVWVELRVPADQGRGALGEACLRTGVLDRRRHRLAVRRRPRRVDAVPGRCAGRLTAKVTCIPESPNSPPRRRDGVEPPRDALRPQDVLVANQRFTDQTKDHEVDLLVLMPGYGIVAVEVKGGSIAHDGHHWTRRRRGRRTSSSTQLARRATPGMRARLRRGRPAVEGHVPAPAPLGARRRAPQHRGRRGVRPARRPAVAGERP